MIESSYRRLHAALLPDYSPKAAAFWWTIAVPGAVALLHSLWALRGLPLEHLLQICIGAGLAMLAGYFPIRVPNIPSAFAAGDVFIFLVLLLHGPEAATVAAAAEALAGSWRGTKRWSSRIASITVATASMFCMGSLMIRTLVFSQWRTDVLLLASVVFGFGYFLLSMSLISAMLRLLRNERFSFSDVFSTFGWVGVSYVAGAALAALLYYVSVRAGFGVLMAMMPMLAMMLATQHYYFRQQEAAEAMRRTVAEAGQRETEIAARHLRELQASERRFHSAFTHASIGMALTSLDGRILQANPALHALLGGQGEPVLQRALREFVVDEDRPELDEALARAAKPGFEGFELELRCRHGNGRAIWVLLHCGVFAEADEDAAQPRLIVQAQDVTARREAEVRLTHIAFHDSLTGLPNRHRFIDLLDRAVRRAQADASQSFALMYLDFDRFKFVNDSLGHHAGDEFLVQVARRIADSLRPGDVVARLGGDEFAVLVLHIRHEHDVVALAERILHAVRRPLQLAGTELSTSASIGITLGTRGYALADDMLRDADAAMYQAKAGGKNRHVLFAAHMRQEAPWAS